MTDIEVLDGGYEDRNDEFDPFVEGYHFCELDDLDDYETTWWPPADAARGVL